ncbi:MAG: SDR family NAD(P)-dependent oxidoreductase, partial [Thermoleophilia bacterium]
PDSVRAVLETKITGLAALVHAIQASDAAPPAWLVAFGSVSGRFGNPGQVAYGAANEAMSALAADVALQWPTTGVRVIQWGPWFDPEDPSLGMVTPPIAALLQERGIPPIRPADGVHALLVEVHHALATRGFEDLIRGDGPWAR